MLAVLRKKQTQESFFPLKSLVTNQPAIWLKLGIFWFA